MKMANQLTQKKNKAVREASVKGHGPKMKTNMKNSSVPAIKFMKSLKISLSNHLSS